MEILIAISNFLILGLIISSPILLLLFLTKKNSKRIGIKYFVFGLFLMVLFIFIFAAWADLSNLILLNHYGYSVDGMNYDNVLPENRGRVDRLVTSIMGIGWPLKAMFGFVMAISYLFFVYFGKILINRLKDNKNEA